MNNKRNCGFAQAEVPASFAALSRGTAVAPPAAVREKRMAWLQAAEPASELLARPDASSYTNYLACERGLSPPLRYNPPMTSESLAIANTGRQRVGILGGTFDPPHIAHLLLGECARLEFGLDLVVFLPAGEPYRKTKPGVATPPARRVSEAHHRVEMTRLATATNPHFFVDEREVHRPGNTYTVDTLESLLADPGFSRACLYLILGSDALADMPYWKAPERIFELANVLIARKRPPGPREITAEIPLPPPLLSLLRGRWSQRAGELLRFDQLPDALPVVSTMPALPVSSTLIRARVADALPIRYMVPSEVEAYIAEHALYGSVRIEGTHA